MPSSNCPCGSKRTYTECCQPYIQGKHAPTAEALMRSRYTAYTLRDVQYLIKTTHPGQQERVTQQKIYQQSTSTLWQKLEVVNTKRGIASDVTGIVEFRASFKESPSGPEKVHHECSSFAKKDGRWYFVFPKMALIKTKTVGRNDLCPCGSGKKFKKCCAQ